ncbi:3-dehydroquinate synthase [Nanchangia anserum]|uniref:Multifunctional fusion protein n=1 Tax=Nanchangia anserum TaxID=2692125 RepID=A0A8I0KQT9_9ACTO|nr:3-dehydroquinate synthase [Nanchangia anserum]MBD3688777.1 3-dehydroquinate synthase [Nanchangia anserum]
MSAPTHSLPEEFFPLVLVGLPGAGKTTVARELSRLVGGAGCDLDSEIKRRTRMTIPEIFRTRGEEGFRDIETETLHHALAVTRGVIALGGGALERRRNRDLLRGRVVIYLQVSPEQAAKRVAGEKGARPLLEREDASVEQVLLELFARRERYYTEVSTLSVRTDSLTPAEIAARCVDKLDDLSRSAEGRRIAASGMGATVRIRVGGEAPYRVSVGHGLASEVVSSLRPETRRVLLIHPEALREEAESLRASLSDARLSVISHTHPEGEGAKDIAVVASCWDALGRHHVTRRDAVVALGGGASTDMGGFVAATWMRGIDVVQVPTTTLGMVDAAVGGKTGINTPQGKNLVGAFYPPRAVIADLDYLRTLPLDEHRSGLAEVIKCGFLADPAIVRTVKAAPEACLDPTTAELADLVERAIRVKADVVTDDLKEAGRREHLNLGHTFAHAIEWAEDYRVRHGDAVAQGMVYAAHVARLAGIGPDNLVEETIGVLEAVGLPTSYRGSDADTLIGAMFSDKKVRSDRLRFVLLREWQRPDVVAIDDRDLLIEAARRVGVRA